MATLVTRSGKGSPLTHAEVDANFTNLNTDKLELSGGTMTGNLSFGDNDKAIFGAGSDLQIYHNGSNSYVTEAGAGNLYIGGENHIFLTNSAGTQTYAAFNGPTGWAKLYYSNSEKLATTSTGIDVTGNATFADNGKAIFGAGSDLQIYHDGSTSFISDQGTGNLKILAQNFIVSNPANTETMIAAVPNGAAELYYDSAKKLATTSTGIDITGIADASTLFRFGVDNSEIANNYLRFKPSGAAYIDHSTVGQAINFRVSNASSLDTTPLVVSSTGIDVTGTVTADGLTVDGNARIEEIGAIAKLTLERGGTANSADSAAVDMLETNAGSEGANFGDLGTNGFRLKLDGSANDFLIQSGAANVVKTRFGIDRDTGDISFYEDTGTTAKFFWDASTERLGIGNAAPTTTLDVTGTVTADGLTVSSSGTANSLTLTKTDGNATKLVAGNTEGTHTFEFNNGGMFLSDTTGLRLGLGSGGDISFYEDTGTTPKFFWDASAESLGIGTSSPSAALHISSPSNARAIKLQNSASNSASQLTFLSNDGTEDAFIRNQSNDTGQDILSLGTGSTERMRIDSSGNVGIGVVPENWLSTYTALQIRSAASVIGSTDNSFVGIGANAYLDSADTRYEYINSDYATQYYQVDGTHVWRYAPSGTADAAITWSEAMRIDSSGNVGIGVSDPSSYYAENLVVKASAEGGITIRSNGTTDTNYLMFADGTAGTAAYRGYIGYTHNSPEVLGIVSYGYMRFYTGEPATERMRIDSSGNLLVGKTSDSFSTQGQVFAAGGYTDLTRAGTVLNVNRLTSDGDIVKFYKDGTTVGSIGTDGALNIGSTNTGIKFGTSAVWATTGGSTNSNGAKDLGASTVRWKDLYLSGGVYLGGTGAANKLDDYEEGTYTATLSPSTSGSITLSSSYNLLSYTKVGRLVTVTGRVRVSSVSSPVGFSANLSLPFATHSDSEESSRTTGCVVVAYAAQPINAYGIHPTTSNVSYVNITRIDASTFPTNSAQDFSGDEHVGIMVTYMTA